jgi:enoyl-CoA hydratase/carnithine racemase
MTPSNDANINYSVEDAVFIISINRPEKKNALTPSMYQALGDGILQAENDSAIHVIVLSGSDDCFTSGNDVSGFVANEDSSGERPSVVFMHAISQANKPVIAAISGLAIGIGTTLLTHCDLVYASQNCFLQMPFSRLGVCPELASSLLLPRFMGHQRAAELLLLGERFSAEQAREYGLVNRVLPQNEYLEFALSKAHELAALPNEAIQTSKRLMKRNIASEIPGTIDLELKEFSRLLKTPEAQAIVKAFLDRKKSA